jgi:hypothetical protein
MMATHKQMREQVQLDYRKYVRMGLKRSAKQLRDEYPHYLLNEYGEILFTKKQILEDAEKGIK